MYTTSALIGQYPCNIRMCHCASSIYNISDIISLIWYILYEYCTNLSEHICKQVQQHQMVFFHLCFECLGQHHVGVTLIKETMQQESALQIPKLFFNTTTTVYSSPHYQCKHPFFPLQQLRAVV